MSGLDIFAWIVLIVLAASTIGVIAIMVALPGMIARGRGHPWAQAVTVAGWVTQAPVAADRDQELHHSVLAPP